ncbi:MAG: sn-glycerol-3-phosphate ABC transporter ATP-binding protein UgpC [Actinomycetota bacterium]|nr:sn-glycerol-3-phosphate ABC transporter ATP-binding protein UgpC [Actinomycetota bacterium]MDQ3628441.1 sn-glycerol-3-phosphate ABC transporter ATP-binding protein UgpC [Actinomycetota bacterium]
MAQVIYDKTSCVYPGAESPAVDEFSLDIADGEFMVFVGPSGCGKSTSLRMLAGLEEVSSGTITIGERDVTTMPPKDRDIAMVFQNYALYPHMSVADNMGFSLKMAGIGKDDRAKRVKDAAELLGLEDYLDRKPKALSGGQRQRVAMGRAIVREPQVFLMDEPLSNLDAKLRVSTRAQIASLQRRLGVTTVYVTHDQVEAMTMGDRVAVLKDGLLQQVDTPLNLYDTPRNAFVAGFIGSPAMNMFTGNVDGDGIKVGSMTVSLTPDARTALGSEKQVTVGIRPEAFNVVQSGESGLEVEVEVVEELGADAFVYTSLKAESGLEDAVGTTVVSRHEARSVPARGATLTLCADADKVHLFSQESGDRIVN